MADKIKQESMPTTGNVSEAPTGSQATDDHKQVEEMEHKYEPQPKKFGTHYPKGK